MKYCERSIKKVKKEWNSREIVYQLFKQVGWEVKKGHPSNEPDLILSLNGKVIGCVILFNQPTESAILGNLSIVKGFLDFNKPKIVILTNLTTYFKSNNGTFEKINYVPTPEDYKLIG